MRHIIASWAFLCVLTAGGAFAQDAARPFEPVSGQPGKDVVWVPTPQETVEKMLDVAKVTPQDFVIDLGSGDGRNVIGAARRGARALGVEYNADMVELSRRRAKEAGVSDRATFQQGDMYEADISAATVLALFLLPDNMNKLLPKFLGLRPGSRIVSNTFSPEGWEADYQDTVPNCSEWCNVLLWIVPASVDGTWTTPQGLLTLDQTFQRVTGQVGSSTIAEGRVRGDEISFTAGGARYMGRVDATTIRGTVTAGGRTSEWQAVRRAEPQPR